MDPTTAHPRRPDVYAGRLLEHFALEAADSGNGGSRSGRAPGLEPLSERELEVLELVAAGRSNAEIAGELYLSVGTVKAHVHHIFGKLLVRNRSQAVARARELRLSVSPFRFQRVAEGQAFSNSRCQPSAISFWLLKANG